MRRPASTSLGTSRNAGTRAPGSAVYSISRRTYVPASVSLTTVTSSGTRFSRPGSGPMTACMPARISARRASQSAGLRTGRTSPEGAR